MWEERCSHLLPWQSWESAEGPKQPQRRLHGQLGSMSQGHPLSTEAPGHSPLHLQGGGHRRCATEARSVGACWGEASQWGGAPLRQGSPEEGLLDPGMCRRFSCPPPVALPGTLLLGGLAVCLELQARAAPGLHLDQRLSFQVAGARGGVSAGSGLPGAQQEPLPSNEQEPPWNWLPCSPRWLGGASAQGEGGRFSLALADGALRGWGRGAGERPGGAAASDAGGWCREGIGVQQHKWPLQTPGHVVTQGG